MSSGECRDCLAELLNDEGLCDLCVITDGEKQFQFGLHVGKIVGAAIIAWAEAVREFVHRCEYRRWLERTEG